MFFKWRLWGNVDVATKQSRWIDITTKMLVSCVIPLRESVRNKLLGQICLL